MKKIFVLVIIWLITSGNSNVYGMNSRELYKSKCSSCHALPEAANPKVKQTFERMSQLSHLTPKQKQQLWKYIQSK